MKRTGHTDMHLARAVLKKVFLHHSEHKRSPTTGRGEFVSVLYRTTWT